MIRAGGVVIVDDSYNAAPGLDARRARAAGRPPGRSPDRRPRRDARARRRPRRGPPRGRRGRRAGARRRWSSSTASRAAAARGIVDGALATGLPAGSVIAVADAADAVAGRARAIVRPGDVVLVKASRGVELERVVDGLVAALGGPEPARVTLELIQGLLLAFALVVILMPPYMRLLRHVGFGKQIREEGPQSHMVKWGTPTMGGLLVIIVVVVIFLVLRWPPQGGVIAPLATLAFVGLLGAVDDYLNARTGEGIRARQKLLWQTVVALFVAYQIQNTYQITGIRVPFVGDVAIDPIVYIFVRRVRDRGLVQRRQHHRRPRRPRPAARSRSRSSRS